MPNKEPMIPWNEFRNLMSSTVEMQIESAISNLFNSNYKPSDFLYTAPEHLDMTDHEGKSIYCTTVKFDSSNNKEWKITFSISKG